MRKFAIIVLLAGCSLIDFGAPKNIDDACSILKQHPNWRVHLLAVERRWNLPPSVQMAIIWQESKFEKRAKTEMKTLFGIIPVGRVSSAYGYGQVLDGTWEWYQDSTGKYGAKRTNFGDSVEFMGWYADITTKKYGVPKSDVRNQYLAYHEGHAGYGRKSYNAKPWLIRVADNLVPRERMYRQQLRRCT